MKHLIIAVGLLGPLVATSQPLSANLAILQFDSPQKGAYVELQLNLRGTTLAQVATPGQRGLRPSVGVQYLIKKGIDTAYFDMYRLDGPWMPDSGIQIPQDFVSIDRVMLKDGKYDLKLTLQDLNDTAGVPVSMTREIVMNHRDFKPYFSDVELVAQMSPTTKPNNLSKSGYDLVPLTTDLFEEDRDELIFYCELYNTDRMMGNDAFVINAFVENADDSRPISDLGKFFKHQQAEVIPVLHRFQISDLPSGNYNLVVEARDHRNELIDSRRLAFYRINPVRVALDTTPMDYSTFDIEKTFVGKYNKADELAEMVDYLYARANEREREQVFSFRKATMRNVGIMKQFLYEFWRRRNPENPEKEWEAYLIEVKKTNDQYTNNLMKGYRTDRGRVYLQYGPPNTLAPYYFEPNSAPYEIWHYYVLDDKNHPRQSNKKFIFANTFGGARDFRLLHSDAMDELYNARWNYELHQRNNSFINLDEEKGRDYVGNKTIDFFNNPR
jgi:GWxTD domain-containing protein